MLAFAAMPAFAVPTYESLTNSCIDMPAVSPEVASRQSAFQKQKDMECRMKAEDDQKRDQAERAAAKKRKTIYHKAEPDECAFMAEQVQFEQDSGSSRLQALRSQATILVQAGRDYNQVLDYSGCSEPDAKAVATMVKQLKGTKK